MTIETSRLSRQPSRRTILLASLSLSVSACGGSDAKHAVQEGELTGGAAGTSTVASGGTAGSLNSSASGGVPGGGNTAAVSGGVSSLGGTAAGGISAGGVQTVGGTSALTGGQPTLGGASTTGGLTGIGGGTAGAANNSGGATTGGAGASGGLLTTGGSTGTLSSPTGGATTTGGKSGAGGATGGTATGGASTNGGTTTGGMPTTASGGTATGGAATGGAATGGAATGGAATGGAATGGTATGGAATGGAATGGAATGGAATGGSTSNGGSSSCPVAVTEMLSSPGFDGTNNGVWYLQSSSTEGIYYAGFQSTNPQAGSRFVFLGGFSGADEVLTQTVVVPASATNVYFSFYYWITSSEVLQDPVDKLFVSITDTSGTVLTNIVTLSNGDRNTGWKLYSTSLGSSVAGKTIVITFQDITDQNSPTSFFIDTVSLGNCP